jgi:hypothetical protein
VTDSRFFSTDEDFAFSGRALAVSSMNLFSLAFLVLGGVLVLASWSPTVQGTP